MDSGFAVAPYQFHGRNCVLRPSGALEPPDVGERERLMGFETGYTLGAVTSSKAKQDPKHEFSVRASLWATASRYGPLSGCSPTWQPTSGI